MAMRSPAQSPVPPAQNPNSVYPDFVDPAAYWALGPGIDYFFLPWRQNKEWFPIVIQLKGIAPEDFLKVEFEDDSDKLVLGNLIQFSQLQPEEPSLVKDGEYYMASANKNFFFDILANKEFHEQLTRYIGSITLGLPLDSISLPPSQGGPQR
jgi:hypothetical protein